MKKLCPAACALLVLLAASVGILCCSSQRSDAQVPTTVVPPTVVVDAPSVTMAWEYKVLRTKVEKVAEKEMNKLGRDAWELVSVTFNPSTGDTSFLFKRAQIDLKGSTPRFTPR